MHIPVLKNEVGELLKPRPGENFIDCTFGYGGHSKLILERNGPNGKVLGIEVDPEVYQAIKQEVSDRLIIVNDNFENLTAIVRENSFSPVNGILFDLGISSWHFDDSGRGFTFQKDEPLDMRLGKNKISASELLNSWPEEEIARILTDYGEEKFSAKIAREIVDRRKYKQISSTFELCEIIREAAPAWYQRTKIHYATKTFQAIRIAVNGELEVLAKTLPQAAEILSKDGRLAVISFHSLEDRIVKNFLRQAQKDQVLRIITKKPIVSSKNEILANPRSRSAKLRAAVKI